MASSSLPPQIDAPDLPILPGNATLSRSSGPRPGVQTGQTPRTRGPARTPGRLPDFSEQDPLAPPAPPVQQPQPGPPPQGNALPLPTAPPPPYLPPGAAAPSPPTGFANSTPDEFRAQPQPQPAGFRDAIMTSKLLPPQLLVAIGSSTFCY